MKFLVAILSAAVILSGMMVAQVAQKHRQVVMALEALERDRVELEADYGRLQLEEGALASHQRVERIAKEQLQMRRPLPSDIMIVLR